MTIFFYIVFFIFFVLLLKLKHNFIIIVPVFQVLVDSSFSYFGPVSFPTFYRAIVLVLMIYFSIHYLKYHKYYVFIWLFMVYTFILVVFSHEPLYSIKSFFQVEIPFILYIVSYHYFSTWERFSKLMVSFVIVIITSLVIVAVGYVFKTGIVLEYAAAEGENEYIGWLGSGGLYSSGVAIGMLPIILTQIRNRRHKNIILIIAIILYIFILLNIRRTAIMIPVILIITYILFVKQKVRILNKIFVGVVILIVLFPLYRDRLVRNYTYRESRGTFEKDFYKKEQRYIENVYLFNTIFHSKDFAKSFFAIGNNIYAEHLENGKIVRRMFHSDSAKLLYGTGLFGLVLYILIYVDMFKHLFLIRKLPHINEFWVTGLGLLLMSLFVSFNGSITLITFRSITFIALGAVMRMSIPIKKNKVKM